MTESKEALDLAWLVGLLEGEGCFYCEDNSSPLIKLVMADLDIVERARSIIKPTKMIHSIKKKSDKHQILYCFKIQGKDAFNWMKKLLPFMGLRRQIKITEIINSILLNRPHIELGNGYCKRGHNVRLEYEYYLKDDGGKQCKRCTTGSRINVPVGNENKGKPINNPFIREEI